MKRLLAFIGIVCLPILLLSCENGVESSSGIKLKLKENTSTSITCTVTCEVAQLFILTEDEVSTIENEAHFIDTYHNDFEEFGEHYGDLVFKMFGICVAGTRDIAFKELTPDTKYTIIAFTNGDTRFARLNVKTKKK